MNHAQNIKNIIAKLSELSSEIKENRLLLIDIDLLKNYTLQLHEELTLAKRANLSNLNTVISAGKTEAPAIENKFKTETPPPPVEINPVMEEKKPEPMPVKEPEIPKAELILETVKPAEIKEPLKEIIEEKPIPVVEKPVPVPEPEPVVMSKPEPETVKQPEPVKQPEIRKQPETAEKPGIANMLQHAKIDDLKKSISIHKKFEFIKRLFNEDYEAYANAIHHLNTVGSVSEAMAHLDSKLSLSFNWKEDDALRQEFYELVKRRYA